MFDGAFLAEGCRVIDGSAIVRRARRVKWPQEITYIEKAVALADIGHTFTRTTRSSSVSCSATSTISRTPSSGFSQEVERHLVPFAAEVRLLDTIPTRAWPPGTSLRRGN
jgi:hypothetical protein